MKRLVVHWKLRIHTKPYQANRNGVKESLIKTIIFKLSSGLHDRHSVIYFELKPTYINNVYQILCLFNKDL